MASKKNIKPRSNEQIAASVRSGVALAAYQQTGAGKHGGNKRQQSRRSRQQARLELRG